MNGPRIQDEQDRAPHAAEEPAPAEALGAIKELRAYAAQYLSAKAGAVKLSIRKAVTYAALAVMGLIALTALIATAVVLAIVGMAQGLTLLLRGHAWAGNLIAGFLVLGMLALVTWLGMKRLFKSSREHVVKDHERRLRIQRQQLGGHDAAQRAAEYRAGTH
jgi:hypothetical protein